MHISANFDGGNIDVLAAEHPQDIRLAIKADNQSDFFQWFYFKLHHSINDQQPIAHRFTITNANKAAYIQGWQHYQAVASYDRIHWFRVPTSYNGEALIIDFTPQQSSVYFAYFAPYSLERHQNLLQKAQLHSQCELSVLGTTLDDREMSLLKIGTEGIDAKGNTKPVIWLTARQHPGETMAQWFMEGLITRLLDDNDGVARYLREHAVFYLVPNMNPDGSYRGHLRTNAAGINLNREWLTPSMQASPEVYLVREKMLATGVNLFLDIHGDESIPYNFVAGCEGCPSYSTTQAQLQQQFTTFLKAITPEFQTDYGYPVNAAGQANLSLAATWVGEHFGCLSLTLEMPFKDNDLLPDPTMGWSAPRSALLGKDVLTVLYQMIEPLNVASYS